MKVAVSVPDPIFEAAERLAKERRVPRSQIFAEALSAYIETHGSEAVTTKLDAVYEREDSGLDKDLSRTQADSLDHETW